MKDNNGTRTKYIKKVRTHNKIYIINILHVSFFYVGNPRKDLSDFVKLKKYI